MWGEKSMAILTVSKNGKTYSFSAECGESILSVLRRENVFIPAFCGGNKLCGKCKVTASGKLSQYGAEELELLSEAERKCGVRLACVACIEGDAAVSISADGAYSVLTDLGDGAKDEHPSCWESLGAAIDLGTTTVAMYIYSLETRKRVGVISGKNAQQIIGADVISRIEYAITSQENLQNARALIISQINAMLAEICKTKGLDIKKLRSVTVSGNTAMLYLLCGLSPKSIASAPFAADNLFGGFIKASQLGVELPEANVFLIPCISAFVGGDITSGIISSGLYETDKNILFIDFGTNGEIVLSSKGRLTCCSTAAGPAFEAAKISCGVGGVVGAINKVRVSEGEILCDTIGGKPPVGVAGSGLIDAVAALLSLGKVEDSGYMEEPFELAEGVTLQPADIRELQLAKAAVRAGAETLLAASGVSAAELDGVYLTGGFGAGLNIKNAIALGLLPEVSAEKIRVLGNCSGAGAVRALLEPAAYGSLKSAAAKAQTVSLDGNPEFTERFMEYMYF